MQWFKYLKYSIVPMLLAFALVQTPSVSMAKPSQGWYTTTAYEISVAFWTGIEPHYGAFFSGDYGYNQHFLGTGGDQATAPYDGGIANWNWWPDPYFYGLLLPKTWLALGPADSWTASNYQATVFH